MPEPLNPPAAPPADPPAATAPPASDPPPADPPATDPPAVRDPAALLSAYEAEKQKRKDEADARRELQQQLEALQAKVAGTEAAQRVKDEALAAANTRIVKAELKGAAKGKLADPADALIFLDPSTFEVDDDGNVDADQVAQAIDKLIETKPHLAAQGGRFQGGADQGVRTQSAPDIDEQIAAATKAGNHALAIRLKRQKFAEAQEAAAK